MANIPNIIFKLLKLLFVDKLISKTESVNKLGSVLLKDLHLPLSIIRINDLNLTSVPFLLEDISQSLTKLFSLSMANLIYQLLNLRVLETITAMTTRGVRSLGATTLNRLADELIELVVSYY